LILFDRLIKSPLKRAFFVTIFLIFWRNFSGSFASNSYKPIKKLNMKKNALVLLFMSAIAMISCSDKDDGPYADYLVARPITMSSAEFKANAVSITDPVPIETSGKIYTYKNCIFVNDVNRGFHVIDNSDPTSPQNIAFIKLEGNNDISVKDDKLFADSYGDLVIFDISNAHDITLSNRIENAIYDNYGWGLWTTDLETPQADFYDYGGYDYQTEAVIGWEVKTEKRLVSEYENQYGGVWYSESGLLNASSSGGDSAAPTSNTGQGGSLARFKIVDDYLYVVDYSNINIINISDLENPEVLEDVYVGWDIETIFNQGDILFLGGMQGMYIYDITEPSKPTFISEFRHGRSCDPVVVDGNYAYVTLRGGNVCGNAETGLYIVDVSNLADPQLKVIYPMDEPYGLGVKGHKLFVCDGNSGLKVYDKTDTPNITELNHFPDIFAYDVIPLENSLLMIGDKVLYQYEYIENDIRLLSTFELH